jgi:hypothetical protein
MGSWPVVTHRTCCTPYPNPPKPVPMSAGRGLVRVGYGLPNNTRGLPVRIPRCKSANHFMLECRYQGPFKGWRVWGCGKAQLFRIWSQGKGKGWVSNVGVRQGCQLSRRARVSENVSTMSTGIKNRMPSLSSSTYPYDARKRPSKLWFWQVVPVPCPYCIGSVEIRGCDRLRARITGPVQPYDHGYGIQP